jgi:methylglyoxal synthase
MVTQVRPAAGRRRIALVAHDNKKPALLEWARFNRPTLERHDLLATGTTGSMIAETLGLPVERLLSGPVGGDQQIGAKIAEGLIDLLVFFWDPLEPQPHDPDVKALLRVGAVWNVPMACNRSSADLMISSPLLDSGYEPTQPDFAARVWHAGPSDPATGSAEATAVAADLVPTSATGLDSSERHEMVPA